MESGLLHGHDLAFEHRLHLSWDIVPAPMPTLQEIRTSLVQLSRRHSRVAHEAEDLAHDIILSTLRRGLALEGEAFLRSAQGAALRHGAFLARSAGRRRAREAACAGVADTGVDPDAGHDAGDGAPLSVLSAVLRTTLLLLLSGLEKAELRLALGVSDAALRKRFQALRELGPFEKPARLIPVRTPALTQLRGSLVELLPRLADALAGGGRAGRVLAAGDPDGHGLIFSEALTRGHRTATTDATASRNRTRAKGDQC